MELKKISYSGMSTYKSCPKKYHYSYVRGMWPDKKAEPLVVGSAIHKVLAKQYELLQENKKLSIKDANALFLTELKSEPMDIDEKKRTPETIALDLKPVIDKICKNPLKVKPKNVERFFQVDFKNPLTGEILEPRLSGIIDLDTEDGEIYEHKSAGRVWTDDNIKSTLQHVVYYVGYYNLHHKKPTKIFYHVIYKHPKSGIDLFEVNISDIDIMNFFNVARSIIKNIQNDNWVATPGRFQCRFCDYNNICQNSIM